MLVGVLMEGDGLCGEDSLMGQKLLRKKCGQKGAGWGVGGGIVWFVESRLSRTQVEGFMKTCLVLFMMLITRHS